MNHINHMTSGPLADMVENYMPHGMCLLWEPTLVTLHVVSDLLIALAYFSIPVALGYFAYRRRDLQFRWLFVLFAIFILACGTTHILGAWVLWHPDYWVDGMIKAVTAITSVATAAVLWPLIPQALTLPSPVELARTNARLEAEISERKAIESALRDSEESLRRERDLTRAIINGLPGLFYVITAEGRFDLWNAGLETVTGYSALEIAAMSPTDFFENDEKILVAKNVAEVLTEGPRAVEASLVTRSGRRIPYYFTGQRLGTGTAARLVGVGTDLSARRQLEQALRRSNQELERFADVSAHHLMEPARRLISFSQKLKTRLANQLDDPEALIALNFIEDQANRLRVLLRDIQLYLAADQPLSGAEEVDAERVVRTVVARMANTIQTVGATVTVGQLPSVLIDAPRLADLFGILLANALQYRRPDVSPEIRIDGQTNKHLVRYWVADNGPGIPTEYRERVFQVFERLHPRTDNDSTGIGLSIVRRIVATCGGRIWIEETPGGGATVIVELPVGNTA